MSLRRRGSGGVFKRIPPVTQFQKFVFFRPRKCHQRVKEQSKCNSLLFSLEYIFLRKQNLRQLKNINRNVGFPMGVLPLPCYSTPCVRSHVEDIVFQLCLTVPLRRCEYVSVCVRERWLKLLHGSLPNFTGGIKGSWEISQHCYQNNRRCFLLLPHRVTTGALFSYPIWLFLLTNILTYVVVHIYSKFVSLLLQDTFLLGCWLTRIIGNQRSISVP